MHPRGLANIFFDAEPQSLTTAAHSLMGHRGSFSLRRERESERERERERERPSVTGRHPQGLDNDCYAVREREKQGGRDKKELIWNEKELIRNETP